MKISGWRTHDSLPTFFTHSPRNAAVHSRISFRIGSRCPNQAAPFPGDPRRQSRIHICGGHLDCTCDRRHGHPPHGASRHGTLRQVFSRRQMDRLHRPVRRRRAGVRRTRHRRRAQAAHLLPCPRPAGPTLGLGQPDLWLDQRRQVDPLPVAPGFLDTRLAASLHRADDRRTIGGIADARIGRR